MRQQSCTVDFSGQHLFVALDTSLKRWQVRIVNDVTWLKNYSTTPDTQALVQSLRRRYPGAELTVGYEAGYCGFWIAKQLRDLGVECHVLNPADIRSSQKERLFKTDASDAVKIADALREGTPKPIHIPEQQTLDDRQLIRWRAQCVGNGTRIKNRIKAALAFNGIIVDRDIRANWSGLYIKELHRIAATISPSQRKLLEEMLEEHQNCRQAIVRATRHLRELARQPRYRQNVELLTSIPGFGVISAMMIMTEIEDIKFFGNVDSLCSLIGLVPSLYQSGEVSHVGRIVKRKRRQLSPLFIEAAWTAIGSDPELTACFASYCRRMAKQRAIVKIAHKLVSRMHHVLKYRQPYECNHTLSQQHQLAQLNDKQT